MSPTRIEQVADELYGLHPSDFVATRDEHAKAATSDGDRDAAQEIRKLRRPSTSAWLVNMLRRERRDAMDELAELGEALRSAQASLAGDDLRELSAQRRRLIDRLVPEARALAKHLGHPASDTVLAELETTLQAALVDANAAAAVAEGRLTSALQADTSFGFGFGAAPPTAAATPETPPTDLQLVRARKQLEKALDALDTAERTAATRRREATAADEQLTEATTRAAEAAEALRVAEAQEADAARRATAAHEASTAADADLDAARTRVAEAKTAVTSAEQPDEQ